MKKRLKRTVRRKAIPKVRASVAVKHSHPVNKSSHFGFAWVKLFHHSDAKLALPKPKAVNISVKHSHSFGSGWVAFLETHLKDLPVVSTKIQSSKPAKSKINPITFMLDKLDSLFKKRKKESANLHVSIGAYETGIDALLREIQSRGQVTLEQVETTFNVSKELAEEWAKILEAKGLIELGYPAFGSLMLRKPSEKKGDENEA